MKQEYKIIVEAAWSLLAVCDGAAARDGQGFNKLDTGFVRAISNQGFDPTVKQIRAFRKLLIKYQGQLSGMGYEVEDFPEVVLPQLSPADQAALEAESDTPHESAKYFKLWFGKYKDCTMYHLAIEDRGYLRWLAKNSFHENVKINAKLTLNGEPLEIEKVKVELKLVDDSIGIYSPYNEDLVNIIRTLPNRSWKKTHWETDGISTKKLITILEQEGGYEIIVDPAIREMAQDAKLSITIKGAYCYISNAGINLKQQLKDLMKFRVDGYEYSAKYKSGEWDGYSQLFKYKENKFPVGYLNPVKKLLADEFIEYKITDKTKLGDRIEFEWKGKKLRPYQKTTVAKFIEQERMFASLPTGSGKTVIALKIIEELGLTALILVHRGELLYQWENRIQNDLGFSPGLLGDGKKKEGLVTVAMVQTATNHQFTRKYDLLILDEGHHGPADTYYAIGEVIESKYRLALSATPRREDGMEKKLWAMFGQLYIGATVEDLVSDDYLAKPMFQLIDCYRGRDVNGEWKMKRFEGWQEELSEVCDDIYSNTQLVKKAVELQAAGEKVYMDVRLIRHGKLLKQILDHMGVKAEFIYGGDTTKRRQAVLTQFREDNIILVSTLIKEGVDLPDMSAVFLAGPARSGTENIQKIGRALRPKQGSNEAYIIDRKDNSVFLNRWRSYRESHLRTYYGELFKTTPTTQNV